MNVPEEKIVRRRRLAFNSEVLVKPGQSVRPHTVVARTMLPLPRLFFASAFRALPGGSPEGYRVEWLKKAGDTVDLDEPVARFTPAEAAPDASGAALLFRSPVSAIIEEILEETGQIRLREVIDYSRREGIAYVGERLGLRGRRLKRYLRFKEGDFVEKGQAIAMRVTEGNEHLPGTLAIARAPIAGVVTEVDLERGLVRLERRFKEVELRAGFFGEVESIDEGAVVISTRGRRVWGVCGVGGEAFGRLRVAVNGPDGELIPEMITQSDAGNVLVAGAFVTLDAMRKAAEVGASGIVTGGADHLDICRLLGADFAVAFTGKEDMPFPLIITGEFGKAPMSPDLFDFFRRNDDSWVHLSGRTQIRAGVVRPEIIITSPKR